MGLFIVLLMAVVVLFWASFFFLVVFSIFCFSCVSVKVYPTLSFGLAFFPAFFTLFFLVRDGGFRIFFGGFCVLMLWFPKP